MYHGDDGRSSATEPFGDGHIARSRRHSGDRREALPIGLPARAWGRGPGRPGRTQCRPEGGHHEQNGKQDPGDQTPDSTPPETRWPPSQVRHTVTISQLRTPCALPSGGIHLRSQQRLLFQAGEGHAPSAGPVCSHGVRGGLHRQARPTGLNLPASTDLTCQFWSGWPDLNRRPLDPQSSALTKLRHSPYCQRPVTGGVQPPGHIRNAPADRPGRLLGAG